MKQAAGILASFGNAVNAKFPSLPSDKVQHFTLSFAFGVIAAIASVFIAIATFFEAFFVAMLPGIFKEFKDSQTPGNKWSWGDLVADAIGAAAGVAAVAYAIFLM